jgi:hypothetical protein
VGGRSRGGEGSEKVVVEIIWRGMVKREEGGRGKGRKVGR